MNKEIKGISCDVKNCKYHDMSNTCMAGHIHVGDSTATNMASTVCKTFECCDNCGCK